MVSSTFIENNLGVVVIGRNEGARLVRCLASVQHLAARVYVDSGSIDGSVERAREGGFTVVELRIPPKFTAARARNAGIGQLLSDHPDTIYVQTVDGDCELQPGWLQAAVDFLEADPSLALVYGRCRERFPERSIYNALCDDEWNTPVGEAAGVGGIAVYRLQALRQVNCFNATMIAGEDTELAMRLRKKGWKLWRLGNEMTLHDANITRFSQWWNRIRRAGHGYGEMAFLHPDARDPNWPRSVRSIIFWGLAMPLAFASAVAIAASGQRIFWAIAIPLLLAWPTKMVQLALRQRRRGLRPSVACASGILLMLGKVPQFMGLMQFHWNRISGRSSSLIEYKGSKVG